MLEREEKNHQCFVSFYIFSSKQLTREIFSMHHLEKRQHVRDSKSSINSVMISTIPHLSSNQPNSSLRVFRLSPL